MLSIYSSVCVCLSVCCQNAKMWFPQKLSILELRFLFRTWAFQRTRYWTPKIQDGWDQLSWKLTWGHFFSAEGGPILIKFCRLVQNDMLTAVIWSKSKPDVELQYGGCLGEFNGMSSQNHLPHYRVLPPGEFNVIIPELCVTLHGAATEQIQWHVILEPHIILQVAATWWIHCHDSRATLQSAVTWRIQCHDHATLQGVRIPSAILKIVLCRILVFFLNEVWALMKRRLSYRLR